jgi:hypothetical protein
MIGASGEADALGGMHVTSEPDRGRGRALARLHADLELFTELDPARRPAQDRLVEVLGPELTGKLVFALARGTRTRAAAAA